MVSQESPFDCAIDYTEEKVKSLLKLDGPPKQTSWQAFVKACMVNVKDIAMSPTRKMKLIAELWRTYPAELKVRGTLPREKLLNNRAMLERIKRPPMPQKTVLDTSLLCEMYIPISSNHRTRDKGSIAFTILNHRRAKRMLDEAFQSVERGEITDIKSGISVGFSIPFMLIGKKRKAAETEEEVEVDSDEDVDEDEIEDHTVEPPVNG